MATPQIGDEEVSAVEAVLRSGNLAQGVEVSAFEHEFSRLAVNGANCVAVNSGTSALHLALLAAGIGRGDEVIVPSFTFAATANAVVMAGATPVFCDIRSDTYCMDPESVAQHVGPRTAAVIPVHLYGCPADMKKLIKISERHGLFVLEDAAQAHIATIDGVPVGSFGNAAAFSFYPTKNMTSGEGGMIVTHDQGLERTCRLLRNQGQEVRYYNEIAGLNNRMTDIHAAIGRVQLNRLREWTLRRQQVAAEYIANMRGVITPSHPKNMTHVYHQFTIRVQGQGRDRFADQLKKYGVQSGVYYPTPVHKLPSYNLNVELPTTDQVSKECLSIPIRPNLKPFEIQRVIEAVNTVAKEGA